MANASLPRRGGLWWGLALVIGCAVFATCARLSQLAAWKGDPDLYVASGVPMITSLDGYYALHLARLYAAGQFVPLGPAPERHYARPQQNDPGEWYDQAQPKTLPLLSGMLAVLSPLLGGDIDSAALVLPPLLSSLFMIPLFLCCWRLGAPAAGLMGALVATFGFTYYPRTSVGSVDTDALNLFFPWTASFLIVSLRAGQSERTQLLLSAATGVVLYLFYLWYPKPGLTALYAVALVTHLRLHHVSWRQTLLCVAALAACAGVLQFKDALINLQDFATRYLWPAHTQAQHASSAIRFMDVWSTIAEDLPLPLTGVLARLLGRADLAAIGLAGFAAFALSRWRSMAALGPLAMVGALAFVSSQRFVFYLAPFAGIGWGFIVSSLTATVLRWIESRRVRSSSDAKDGYLPRWKRVLLALIAARPQAEVACIVVLVVFFLGMPALNSVRDFIPRPVIPAPIFRELQQLAHRLPAHARIWTWWDYGFAIVDATGFGVYHDGSAQYTPQTNLVAASFTTSDPRTMYDVIRFVDREGNRGILRLAKSSRDFDELLARVRGIDLARSDAPIYVLYTPDMLIKYAAMRMLGSPYEPAAHRSVTAGIRLLRCERIVDDRVDCAGQTLDLRSGAIEGSQASREPGEAPRLRRAVIVDGGHVVREREYPASAGLTAEIVYQGPAVKGVYLLDEPAFESTFNQMFVLGRFDAARFEIAYDDFPYARVYRVIQ